MVFVMGLGLYHANGQNLVMNPGFEDYVKCYFPGPIDTNRINPPSCPHWWTANKWLAHHKYVCGNLVRNENIPRTGVAYAQGHLLLSQWTHDRRNFFQTRLAAPLEPGCTYEIIFYVRPLGFKGRISTQHDYIYAKDLGAHLSKERVHGFNNLVQVIPQVLHEPFLNDTTSYTKISGKLIGDGGEQYLTIGIFTPEGQTVCQSADGNSVNDSNCMFLFGLDDVSVRKVPANPEWSNLLPNDTMLSWGSSLKLVTGVANTIWSTGAVSSEITVDKPGEYWYSIEEACFTHFDTIRVISDGLVLHIPNAFTPNRDGLNDQLEFWMYGAKKFSVLIYDRWGQMIYEQEGGAGLFSWDGKVNGKDAMQGVYILKIIADGEQQTVEKVHLIR